MAAHGWFKIMKVVDKHFALMPWKQDDADKPIIRKAQDIPNIMGKFRVYFNRAQVKKEGRVTYHVVYAQHSMVMKDMKEDIEWKLKEIKVNMFKKSLHVESTDQMG